MTRRRILGLAAAPCLSVPVCVLAADKKKPKSGKKNEPEVLVSGVKILRDADGITVDGRMKNVSGKPLRGLVVFFEFLEPGGRMISRMHTEVGEGALAVDEEGTFEGQTPDQVRAVWVRLEVEDKDGRYLRLNNPGPYTIE